MDPFGIEVVGPVVVSLSVGMLVGVVTMSFLDGKTIKELRKKEVKKVGYDYSNADNIAKVLNETKLAAVGEIRKMEEAKKALQIQLAELEERLGKLHLLVEDGKV